MEKEIKKLLEEIKEAGLVPVSPISLSIKKKNNETYILIDGIIAYKKLQNSFEPIDLQEYAAIKDWDIKSKAKIKDWRIL